MKVLAPQLNFLTTWWWWPWRWWDVQLQFHKDDNLSLHLIFVGWNGPGSQSFLWYLAGVERLSRQFPVLLGCSFSDSVAGENKLL